MPRNTCKRAFLFRFNSERPQIWDSVSNYHLDGLNKLTRPISVLESAILLFTSLCFSVYVNSATFSSSVEMAPKFTFRFIIPKYRGWQNRIFKIPLRDCIFKARVFSSFFKPIFVLASSANQTLFLYLKNKAIKFFVQARIDAKLKMKVSLIALEVLKCQLFHFESRKSDFPSPL